MAQEQQLTPIIYTGGSLEIATNRDISAVAGNPTPGAFLWKYSNLTFNGSVGQSSSEPLNALSYLSAYGTGGTYRPNIQITHQPTPDCSGTHAPGNTYYFRQYPHSGKCCALQYYPHAGCF